MKLSIIVPVYNAEKYLAQCLDSLVSQTIGDYELILINDGSKDGSAAIMAQYEKRCPQRVKCVTVENGGQGRARNIGLSLARGEYIGFADSDDWVEPDMFQAMYQAAEESRADVAVCDALEFHEDGAEVYLPMSQFERPEYITTAVWNKLFKKSALEGIQFPEGLWYEDLYFVMAVMLRAGKAVKVPRALYHYRCGQVSTMNNNNAAKNLDMLKILDSMKAFMLPEHKGEFEALLLGHLLLDTINRVSAQKSPDKGRVIKKLRLYARENLTRLSSCPAYRRESPRRRIIMGLNYHGLHPVSALIFALKRRGIK